MRSGRKHGVKMDFTPPEGHEKVAERNVRTVKEHVYASIIQLGHAIDDIMLEGMVRDTVSLINFLPSAEVDRSSPRTIIGGATTAVGRASPQARLASSRFPIVIRVQEFTRN